MYPETLNYLIKFVKEKSGIILSVEKAYLIESRLLPIVKMHNVASIDELVELIRNKKCQSIENSIVDAMTTNESFFFRDNKPFDQFKNIIIPDILEKRKRAGNIKIWSAASSTGQEPYSLAILLNEMMPQCNGQRFQIMATDISEQALCRAKQGLFSQFEVQRGLSAPYLLKYFSKHDDMWKIKDNVKNMVTFKKFNLLDDFGKMGDFDVVFIRNVLIYFDLPTKRKILDNISSIINADGYVCLGGTETIIGVTDTLTPCKDARGLYKSSQKFHKSSREVAG